MKNFCCSNISNTAANHDIDLHVIQSKVAFSTQFLTPILWWIRSRNPHNLRTLLHHRSAPTITWCPQGNAKVTRLFLWSEGTLRGTYFLHGEIVFSSRNSAQKLVPLTSLGPLYLTRRESNRILLQKMDCVFLSISELGFETGFSIKLMHAEETKL